VRFARGDPSHRPHIRGEPRPSGHAALKTAVDAVHASGRRITAGSAEQEPLAETAREGSLAVLEEAVQQAERAVLQNGGSPSRKPMM
jgi:hypothetical protein